MSRHRIVLTHEHADFDAIASMVGATRLYPAFTPILPKEINRNVETFLSLYGSQLKLAHKNLPTRGRLDCVLLVDTQTMPSLRGMHTDTEVRVIDHHAPASDTSLQWDFRGRPTGACSTLVTELLRKERILLSPSETTLLLLGIYEDTGSLTYGNTTPDDLRAAAWLVEQGAKLSLMHEFLHHPLSPGQQRLYELLVQHAEFHNLGGHTVALALVRSGEYVGEVSTLAHLIRNLYDPAALFIAVQMDSHIQIVARSTTDAINVGHVMRHLGGGGHPRAAAAFRDEQPLDALRQHILGLLATHVQPAATVSQIMSHGRVHTLLPDTTIRQADELMRRWGHEGFPVVEKGSITGVLRRQDVDKAIHHGLGDETARKFMRKGPIMISPHDSVERLQDVMTTYRIGQVPVIQEGRVVGIVTRTDLLKLWTTQSPEPLAGQITALLQRTLSPALLELIHEIGTQASKKGDSLYVVGGLVRDLLLSQQPPDPCVTQSPRDRIRARLLAGDIDLVVEGDAITLARNLAHLHGGRVRSHARFGTAKWILAGTRYAQVRPFIDLVTARTEFYESPSALPNVERSSIQQDLHRRDFTINTLAICLDEGRYGHLLDFYGGAQDLKKGIVRVLHNLSFVEDPTRILRAVRMEQRFGFTIEERTEELLRDSVGLLSRVSGGRLRSELDALFREESPAPCLSRLQELGVLGELHPAFRYDDWVAKRFAALPERLLAWRALTTNHPDSSTTRREENLPRPGHYLSLLTFRLGRDETEAVIQRLELPRSEATLLRQVQSLRERLPDLQAGTLCPSQLYHLLRPYHSDALFILWMATDKITLRERLASFESRLRWMSPHTDGHILQARGLRPGPIYREILGRLRDALLDGEITTPEEEEVLVDALIRRFADES